MKMRTRSPLNRQIIDEAASWFVEFRAGDIDTQARKEFHQWLRRSPDHIQAYLDIAATYAELPAPNGELDVQALIDAARPSPDPNVVPLELPFLEVPGSVVSGISGLTRSARTRSSRALAIAASFLLATTAIGTWLYIARDTYTTSIGEHRSLTLADGSTVELNSRSRIRIRYTDDERRIVLLDGQALFQVAKNARRPFIVHVNDTQVRAVGTQFDVYRKPSATIVTVIEGRVAILPTSNTETAGAAPSAPVTAAAPSAIFLGAGEQLTVGPKTAPKPHAINPNTATAWTQRQLIFENASLNEVAEEFNRYSARTIIVETGNFDTFHISGTYSSTNPESLLRFLRVQPGIKLVESDSEIRIARE